MLALVAAGVAAIVMGLAMLVALLLDQWASWPGDTARRRSGGAAQDEP